MSHKTIEYWLFALVVGTVSFGVIDVGKGETALPWRNCSRYECPGIADGHDEPTKSRNVLLSSREHVEVFGPSPYVDKLFVSLGIQYVLLRDGRSSRRWNETSSHPTFWRYECSSWLHRGSVKIEPDRENGRPHLAFCKHAHMFGGSISTVLPVGTKMPEIFAVGFIKRPMITRPVREDECPLVYHERFFSQTSLRPGDTGKNNSKHSNDDSSNRRYGPVIVAGSDAAARGVQTQANDKFDEEGAFFVKGIVGLLLLALLYTLLKRL